MSDLKRESLDPQVLSVFNLVELADAIRHVYPPREHLWSVLPPGGVVRRDKGIDHFRYPDGSCFHVDLSETRRDRSEALSERLDLCFRFWRKMDATARWRSGLDRLHDPAVGEIAVSGEVVSGDRTFHRRLLLLGDFHLGLPRREPLVDGSNPGVFRVRCQLGEEVETFVLCARKDADSYEVALPRIPQPRSVRRLSRADFQLLEGFVAGESFEQVATRLGGTPRSVESRIRNLRARFGLERSQALISAWTEWRVGERDDDEA